MLPKALSGKVMSSTALIFPDSPSPSWISTQALFKKLFAERKMRKISFLIYVTFP